MDLAATNFILTLLETEDIISEGEKEAMMERARRVPMGVTMAEATRIIKEG